MNTHLYKILASFWLILFFTSVKAQRMEYNCRERVDSLLKSGMDSIIYYQPYLSPLTQEGDDSCMINDRRYLLWKSGKDIFILKYYDSYNFYTNTRKKFFQVVKQNDSLQIFEFLKNNFQRTVKDTLLSALLRRVKDNKEEIWDLNRSNVRDDAYTQIMVFADGKIYENGYASTDLHTGILHNEDGSVKEKWESLHYETNINKPIYQIITKIEIQIAFLEKSNAFK